MKRFILTTAVALSAATCISASDYVPMIREGRVWEYTAQGTYTDPNCTYIHYLKFDGNRVEANGKTYNRVVLFKTNAYRPKQLSEDKWKVSLYSEEDRDDTMYYMREEDGRVYTLVQKEKLSDTRESVTMVSEDPVNLPDNVSTDEFLVYDWNRQEGETMLYPILSSGWEIGSGGDLDLVNMIIRYQTPVSVEGEECKVKRLENEVFWIDMDVIEGIGPTFNGTLGALNFTMISGVPDNSRYPMLQCRLNRVFDGEGNVVYERKDAWYPEKDIYEGMPLLKVGKVWVWNGINRIENKEMPVYFTVTGTEETDGKICYRVEQTSEISELSGLSFLLYEEDGNVSIRYTDSSNNVSWLPLFDFSMKVGEKRQIWEADERSVYELVSENCWEISDEDAVVVNGVSRRRMNLVNDAYNNMTIWVEGIGAPYFRGQLTWFYYPEPDNGIYLGEFKECIEDGKTVFTRSDFGDLGSVEGISDDSVTGNTDDTIYDVLGRRVNSTVPGGVYIRGGKKFVAN